MIPQFRAKVDNIIVNSPRQHRTKATDALLIKVVLYGKLSGVEVGFDIGIEINPSIAFVKVPMKNNIAQPISDGSFFSSLTGI